MLANIRNTIVSFFKDEEGQGMTEYIIILVVVAIAAIGAFIIFRGKLTGKVEEAGDAIEDL